MVNEFGKISVNPSTIEDLANEFTDEYAVINEIIANAYDASASNFKIILNKDNNKIIFIDNGIGMSKETAQKGFLEISNNKRNNEDYKNSARKIMGRKGSGRIGLFGVAKKIYVYSQKNNNEPIAFLFDVPEILNNHNIIQEIPYNNEYINHYQTGTKIIIEDFFNKKIFENLSELKYVIYENFFPVLAESSEILNSLKMYIELIKIENGIKTKEIVEAKTDIFKKLDRFMNIKDFENKEVVVKSATLDKDKKSAYGYNPNTEESKNERIINFEKAQLSLKEKCNVKNKYNEFEEWILKISKGWIGTLATIDDKEDNKSYCVKVYSRNRLVIQDIRKDFKIDRFYLNYLVGDIFVDDLDSDELKDITKISRNAYGNQDERYQTVVKLVKSMANKLILEKSKLASKNKKISDVKNTKVMGHFLDSAKKDLSLNNELFSQFKAKAIKELKVKSPNDKRIIFISHKSIHETDEGCLNYSQKDILCFNSFLIGLFLTTVFNQIKEKKNLDDDNFKIIFTSLYEYSPKLGNDIHRWLRDESFDTEYHENTIFYACISCKYIKNWNTDIEYGASWFAKKQGTYCIVDPFVLCLPNPISSEIYEKINLNISDKSELNRSIKAICSNFAKFQHIFLNPLESIGIKINKHQYDEYIVKNLNSIVEKIWVSYKGKYQEEIEKKENINKKINLNSKLGPE